MTTLTTKKATRAKPNLYISPNAPPWLKKMLRDVFSDANKLSREQMDVTLGKQVKLARAANRRRSGRKPIGARAMTDAERARRYYQKKKKERDAKKSKKRA
jgi:hypothetical protein